jgi:AraC-like DNA-binding protein
VLDFLTQLDTKTSNMARAAMLSGFGSYSQCHRVFSEVIGVSPREFMASGVRREHASEFDPF